MKRKSVTLLLLLTLSASSVACGDNAAEQNTSTPTNSSEESVSVPEESNNTEPEESAAASGSLGDIEVEKGLFSVELTIPADYIGETTQEELDKAAEESGIQSITLNDDGSATYIMTKAQHEEMMKEIAVSIHSALKEMVGSENYPNITDITANSDFTVFTVTTESSEIDMNESFSILTFYMYGGMYAVFNGTEVDSIHIDFVNASSGEVIYSSDSSDMTE